MRPSEILDLMGKADKHYNFVRIVVFDSNADELVSDGTPLFEALIKDICPAVESIKMIRDEAIDGNLDFSSPFGEKIRQRLQSLKDDAMLMADKLGDVQKRVLYTDKDLFDSVHCLLMNLFAILNNISDIWKYVTPGTQGAQGGEASARQQARVIDREGIKAMFMQDSESQRKAEAFVDKLVKLAANGEKDKAFAMCAAKMHSQLSHNALRLKYQAWAKLWRDLMPLIGAVAKGYENQREKLLKEAKK